MFGRKRPSDDLGPEQRQQLLEAYRPMLAEIDEIINRCSWFLEEKNLAEVPPEYHQPLRDTLERERALREITIRRMEALPHGPIVIAELGEEVNMVNQATHAANDLIKRAGTDAAASITLRRLLDKGHNVND